MNRTEFIRTRERLSVGAVFVHFMERYVIRHIFMTIFLAVVLALSLGTFLRHHQDAKPKYYREAASLVKEFPELRGDLRGYCVDGKMTIAEFCALRSSAKGLRTERMLEEPISKP